MGQVGWGIRWVIAELVHGEVVGNVVGAIGNGVGGWGISGESVGKGWEGLEDSLELFHRTRRQHQLNGLHNLKFESRPKPSQTYKDTNICSPSFKLSWTA
jgi:hypothetical protein